MKPKTTWGLVLMSIVLVAAGLALRSKSIGRESVLLLEIGGKVPELAPWNPLVALFQTPPPTVLDKVMALSRAKTDPRVRAVVLKLTDFDFGMGKAQEFRAAIADYRQSHKPIVAYLELEGSGNLEYYLATACDKIYVSEQSFLALDGLSSFHVFLGGVWEKLYLDLEVDQIKEYKSAADMLAQRQMTAANREAANSILDSLNAQFLGDIARARGRKPEQVQALVDDFLLIPDRYRAAGWVDGLKYLDQVLDEFKKGSEVRVVREEEYLKDDSFKIVWSRGPKVKVIYGVGNIVTGDPGGRPLGGQIMGSDRMVKELLEAAEDDSIKAVVFRIDSGGGSALASDLIWRATQKLREKKPLIVSMSDVAGSGGYYIACGADAIVAEPATITGSIGIFTAHLSLQKLLDKAGIGTATLTRGKFAGSDTLDKPLSEPARAKQRDSIQALYDIFLRKVAQGRKLTPERVNEIGRGRIWTGAQAKDLGLVDELGGVLTAVELAKTRLGAKEVELVWQRPPVSLWKLLTGKAEQSLVQAVLQPEEIEYLTLLRTPGNWRPGEPLFLMAENITVH